MPVWSHTFSKPLHALHDPNVVALHIVPSVSRLQASVSDEFTSRHEPPMHCRSVRVRIHVPDSSQVPEKPPHVPHAPKVVGPQPSPSVSRMHAADSMRIDDTHVPLTQS